VNVLVAMSGGVDSSVAAALLCDEGHDVVGVTMRLWGGPSDSGCCAVSDVDDASRVAQQLGIDHHVFNFSDEFEAGVVAPYVDAHARGTTPNPCIECNRTIKFARLAERADDLGFDVIATGHHARVVRTADGGWRVGRGADRAKDQSYVLHMLGQRQLARTLLPVGDVTKARVREIATEAGLRTAAKDESQDVCFITSTAGRQQFLAERLTPRPAIVVDTGGRELATVASIEMVTIGQRRGLGIGGGPARYVVDIDPHEARVVVGGADELQCGAVVVESMTWAADLASPAGTAVRVQTSAHGAAHAASTAEFLDDATRVIVRFDQPQRRVAPGQSVVLYDVDDATVLGGGIVASGPPLG